jgi:hypothetical protein
MGILMHERKKEVVPGESGPLRSPALFSGSPYLLLLGFGTALGLAVAGCSSPSQTEAQTDSLRPCPRHDNHMPASLKTPCVEIDGKYYRID